MKETSNQTAHTPGPKRYLTEADKAKLSGPYYNACNLNTDMKGTIRTSDGGHLVATLELYGKEAESVSCLFAAAPELLAALKSAMDRLEGFTHRIGFPLDDKRSLIDAMSSTATEAREEIKAIRAAIAQAKGGAK